jgi:DNA-binding NtrC family response regulator
MSQFLTIKVLVADDSRTIQHFFKDVVATAPMPIEMLTADTGTECRMLLEQGGIDVAFVDVLLPEMSGMEAVGRARFAGNKSFVVMMSNTSDARRLQVARQVRAYEFLVKPFTPAAVLALLKTYQSISRRTKTLIVDDSRTIRQVIMRVLKRSVFNLAIEEAGSGERALKLFSEGTYDLVFLDYNMPGLDGLNTLDGLRADDPNTKIIMISAERNDVHVRDAMNHGAVTFLHKPFFAVDVDRALHAALGLRLPELALSYAEDDNAGKRGQADSSEPAFEDWERAVRELSGQDAGGRSVPIDAALDGDPKGAPKTVRATI